MVVEMGTRTFGLEDMGIGPLDETGRAKPQTTKHRARRGRSAEDRAARAVARAPQLDVSASDEPINLVERHSLLPDPTLTTTFLPESLGGDILDADYPTPRPTSAKRRASHMVAAIAAAGSTTTNKETAALVGLDVTTIRGWIRRGHAGEEPFRTFVALYMRALHTQATKYVSRLDRAGEQGDVKANIALLDRHDRRVAEHDPNEDAYSGMTEDEFLDAMSQREDVIRRVLANQKSLESGEDT